MILYKHFVLHINLFFKQYGNYLNILPNKGDPRTANF